MRTLNYGLGAMVIAASLLQPQARAHEEHGGRWQGLEGVWLVKLAPRDCTTGNPLPVPPIQNLFTFNGDGTLSASMQNYAVSYTNRSLSHGLWRSKSPGRGRGEYVMRFTHLRYDFASGVYLGTQEALSQVALARSGEQFTAVSQTRGIDANGNQAYTGCANLTGDRMPQP